VIKYYGWKKVTIFQLDIDSFEVVRLPALKDFIFILITLISCLKNSIYTTIHREKVPIDTRGAT